MCIRDSPYALGLIATRSLDQQVTGLKELMAQHQVRIRNGMKAYELLQELRTGNTDPAVRNEFNKAKQDLGYEMCIRDRCSGGHRPVHQLWRAEVGASVWFGYVAATWL